MVLLVERIITGTATYFELAVVFEYKSTDNLPAVLLSTSGISVENKCVMTDSNIFASPVVLLLKALSAT